MSSLSARWTWSAAGAALAASFLILMAGEPVNGPRPSAMDAPSLPKLRGDDAGGP